MRTRIAAGTLTSLITVALSIVLPGRVAIAQETTGAGPAATVAPATAGVNAGATITADDAAAPGAAAAAVAVAVTPTREAPFERGLPASLRRTSLFDLRVWQWMALPILLMAALVLAALAAAIVRRALRPAVARTETTVDDAALRGARGPLLFAFAVMFFAAGLPMLALADPVQVFLRGLLKGLGVLALSWASLRLLDVFSHGLEKRLEREGRLRAAALVPLGRRSSKIFLSLLAVVLLLQNVGLDVTGLIAGLGVGGIAIALAAQKTIENVFGGISVITDQPVRVGELCRFRDGRMGVVEEIGLRSTRIRTPERTLVTIPNADFAQRELENLAARDRMRLHTVIGLRYETTPQQLREVLDAMRKLISGHPMMVAETVRIFFIGFGASSLDVEISAYVATREPDDFNAVREEILLKMIDTIEECGTGLARPVTVATVAPPAA
jgi:MscS family membrane protein